MAKQNELKLSDNHRAFFMEIDSVDEDQLMALENIQLNKLKVAQAYNKHVRKKEFKESDLIWKTFYQLELEIQRLPNGHQTRKAH